MSKKRDFGEGIIYTITNYLWWFLLGNFYFWLMNIPFVVIAFIMLVNNDSSFNLILILSLMPMGPALTALLSVMGKVTRKEDVDLTKDFFNAYKVNFLDSLFFSISGLIILTIVFVEIMFFNNNSKLYFIGSIPRIILFICFSLAVYIFPIISRFYLRKKDVLKLSIMCLIRKIYVCLITFAIIFIMWMIFTKINSEIMVLFSVSIGCYLIMFLEKPMLQEIEVTIQGNNGSNK